jgi:glycine dehydrogenase
MNHSQRAAALRAVGADSVADLLASALPPGVGLGQPIGLPAAVSEHDMARQLRRLAARNHPLAPLYGLGYWPTLTPAVIRRTVLENPAWYSAYTPYQPEISQGRLEALLVFQTMVADLMGLPVANASLLDEATGVAEAISLARRAVRTGRRAILDAQLFPASLAVAQTRARAAGIPVEVRHNLADGLDDAFCVVMAQCGVDGQLRSAAESAAIVAAAHAQGALVVVAADLLAATLVTPPGAWGADVAVGSAQRFGVPLWYGGPAAGFMAVRAGLERQLPGRLVGESVDADGTVAYRLALQTREQHIRREKATSNICTAQVLPAVVAGLYAVWHGPTGLRGIAEAVHAQAASLAEAARRAGYDLESDQFFDTVAIRVPGRAKAVRRAARQRGIGVRRRDRDTVCLTFGEGVDAQVMAGLARVLGLELAPPAAGHLGDHQRGLDYLTHPVFTAHQSETAFMRYTRALADRDYALDRGMIPLGSCTMKLNPATAMEAISLPGFADLHPYCQARDAQGYRLLMRRLSRWLCQITGYDAVSLQPNAGSQGEFSALLAIRDYLDSIGQSARRVCLIPTSAHGTNAASAAMAGLSVVPVAVGPDGAIDLEDVAAKIDQHGEDLAALMVTDPSTHGVYEDGIHQVCQMVHAAGGQVFIDGANLNALAGVARLGDLGGDASHLNLHKTFAIPHGGGGPGVGPVAVKAHLARFLPGAGTTQVAGSPHGSAGVLPISYAYIAMLGDEGLRAATADAVLAANYVSRRLSPYYPTLYVGANSRVAHECILDLRGLTQRSGVTVDDVAKRLIDYGFHAPTMSFPVPGTLMVEPTESESLVELDRFCDAMIAIRAEIDQVAAGVWPANDNPLRNAPHPAARLVGDWHHPYPRQLGVYPAGAGTGPVLDRVGEKFWPPVARIDQAWGDRHLVVRLVAPASGDGDD